ncbi:Hypothetical predicted protein [Mytilus galloprovincialis]|uniref:LRAT domain-containing protein n=1 Tax=Mytilus galloprovincialis TaxID=29158 RepID=A0A8B6C441_MYTGA|nr:Hypothetical predicted protein [Mytilus galloprovincialis]
MELGEEQSLIISTFDEFYKQVKQKEIGKFSHFKVERKRGCCSYSHHFMLLEILKIPDMYETEKNLIQVVIGHYTSSIEICTNDSNFGVGKFVCEKKDIKRNETSDLFDFSAGLFLAKHTESIQSGNLLDKYTRQERLCEQLGEREYDFRHNNCEHAINCIISGKRYSKEADEKSCCADFCTTTIGEFKEVGLKVALIIAFVSSLAGSLIRYSYISLIVAGTILYTSHEGKNGTCSTPKILQFIPLGKNVIKHAKHVLDHHTTIHKLLDDPSGQQIIEDIESTFEEAFICKIAFDLAYDAIMKTINFSIFVSVSIESIFLIIKLRFTFCPLLKRLGWKSTDVWRKIVTRVCSGYLSIFVGILSGFFGQAIMSPPAVFYFLFNLLSSIVSRYMFTLLIGFFFDLLFKRKDIAYSRSSGLSSCFQNSCCCNNGSRKGYSRIPGDKTICTRMSLCCRSCCSKETIRSIISTCYSLLSMSFCSFVFLSCLCLCIFGIIYPFVKYLD